MLKPLYQERVLLPRLGIGKLFKMPAVVATQPGQSLSVKDNSLQSYRSIRKT